jgi:hypothetical protein
MAGVLKIFKEEYGEWQKYLHREQVKSNQEKWNI